MKRLQTDRIHAHISVDTETKTLALMIALLESLYSYESRKKMIRTLAFYFGVTAL